VCALALALAFGSVPELRAQESGTVVGVLAGAVRTTQLWTPEAEGTHHDGLIAGAWAESSTPAGWLAVGVEGAYAQRGGDVELEVGGQPAAGALRMGYLSFGVRLVARRAVGPVTGYAVVGPTLDQVLSRRVDPVLAQVFEDETPTVFGVTVGGGITARLSEGLVAGAELRLTEGLGDAHQGASISVRNRSVEAVLRVGVPLARLRGG
jgi:hypothetical protein